MNRTLHRLCHNTWTCAVIRNKSQVVLRAGQVSNNQIPAKGSQNPTQSFFWALELVQQCWVSSWGINSHHLPAATEALAVLLDLKANGADYKVTFYILNMHLSLLLSLTRENSSLVPHAFKAQKPHFGWIVFMDDYFLEKPLGMHWGGVYQWRICIHLITKTT